MGVGAGILNARDVGRAQRVLQEHGNRCAKWALAHFLFVRSEMSIESIIEQTVVGMGFDLVDLELSPRGRLIRIFIDCPEALARPVNVEDCALVSNQLTRVFAVENIDYDRLEVSSPGMDRPLVKLADFARFAGQEAQVRVRVPIEGQRNFSGVLAGVKEGVVCLETAKGPLTFELDQIDKARLVPKF